MRRIILISLVFLSGCSLIFPTEYRKEQVAINMEEVRTLLKGGYDFQVYNGKVVLIKNTGSTIIIKDVFAVFQKE
jgi:hypothetical protein